MGDVWIAGGIAAGELFAERPLVLGFDGTTGEPLWDVFIESLPGDGRVTQILEHEGVALVAGSVADERGIEHASLVSVTPHGVIETVHVLGLADAAEVNGLAREEDGAVLLIGSAKPGADRWAARFDVERGVVLETLALAPGSQLLAPEALVAVADGWVVAGKAADSRRWVGRLDADLDLVWERVWDEFGPFDLSVATDGESVFVAGSELAASEVVYDHDIWVVALDADDGTERWQSVVTGHPDATEHATGLAVDPGGGVWVAGQIATKPLQVHAPWDMDAWVTKYDRDGDIELTVVWDGAAHRRDAGGAILAEDSGSAVVFGSSEVAMEGANPWIAKFSVETPGAGATFAGEPELVGGRSDPPSERQPHATSVFLDFDGGHLSPGDWGTHGQAACLGEPVEFPGYGGTRQDADLIVELVREALLPYDIEVWATESPPEELPFSRVMIGAYPEQLGLDEQTKGYACVIDCADEWSRDLVFAFDDGSPTSIARNAVHELAHGWGLDHLASPDALMSPHGGAEQDWADVCTPLSEETGSVVCSSVHERHCDAGEQDSDAELTAAFGTRVSDEESPTIDIETPDDGVHVAAGTAVQTVAAASDDRGNPGLSVSVPGLSWKAVASAGAIERPIALPPGTHELVWFAVDDAGNTTEVRRTVVVDAPP